MRLIDELTKRLNAVARKADQHLRGEGDLHLETSHLQGNPALIVMRGTALIVCYLREFPFDLKLRGIFKLEAETHFGGSIVRFWAEGEIVTLVDAITERTFELKALNTTQKRQMSKWEWASFGCQVFVNHLVKDGKTVLDTITHLSGPPTVWHQDADGQIEATLVVAYPRRLVEPKLEVKNELLVSLATRGKQFSNSNLQVSVTYICFADRDNDPFDPEEDGPIPIRRAALTFKPPRTEPIAKLENGIWTRFVFQ